MNGLAELGIDNLELEGPRIYSRSVGGSPAFDDEQIIYAAALAMPGGLGCTTWSAAEYAMRYGESHHEPPALQERFVAYEKLPPIVRAMIPGVAPKFSRRRRRSSPGGVAAAAANTTGGVPPGTDVVPGHAAGDFICPTRNDDANKKPTFHDGPSPDDNRNGATDRVDADPPYSAEVTSRVERFRKLLAALIAKQLLSNERNLTSTRDRAGD